ncbi:MAG: transposase [Planctomycetia bacterium]|nr:transposase [Planctomycetia bacterium]
MHIFTTDKLFDWKSLDDAPDLKIIQSFLNVLPDEKILVALRTRRYKGRNDYPVSVLWRVHLLRYILRHPDMAACLADLGRNPLLRELCLIDSPAGVPKPWNMSRFEEVLGEPKHLTLLREMFNKLIRKLGSVVPDLGQHTAADSACLKARADTHPENDTSGLPQPTGGKKEYRDEKGQVVRSFIWFGYKFHLLVDVKHEVILTWHITTATDDDAGEIPKLLAQALSNVPQGRMETLGL